VFHQYYITLYKGQEISSEKVNEYLHKQNLLKITENQRQILNGLITIRELCEAIQKTKAGKAPGPDGLPASYYKCFEDELLQPLQQRFLDSQ